MNLPSNAIDEFREIIKKEFGVDMTPDQASLRANEVLRFFYEFFLWRQNELAKTKNSELNTKIDAETPTSGNLDSKPVGKRQLTIF